MIASWIPPGGRARIVVAIGLALGMMVGMNWGSSTGGPGPIHSLPFLLMLASIAVLPLLPPTAHAWERNRSKLLVSLFLSYLVLLHYGTRQRGFHGGRPGGAAILAVLEHSVLRDYLPFLILIFSLYVIAGGIGIGGDLRARPIVNVGFLTIGAAFASLIGTTGASMILIRPLLQTNSERKHVRHTVVFFIFLVSNVGGCLLPTGDPPLFMGYLRGVPFLWTLNLWAPWLFAVVSILAIYWVWDTIAYRRESAQSIAQDESTYVPPRLLGRLNLVWLAGVVLSVALIVPGRPIPGTEIVPRDHVREAILLGLAGLSYLTTPKLFRSATGFRFGPILEVACLFLGIFVTMQPAIELLQARGPGLGIGSPRALFWLTGGLSGVLDNAPTYLVFLEIARTLPVRPGFGAVGLLDGGLIDAGRLAAISLGSVFLGAMTYLGNGPNLLVKSIAEAHGVAMPGFFRYIGYTLAVLLPVFGLVVILFVR